jgi:hypothetical protein
VWAGFDVLITQHLCLGTVAYLVEHVLYEDHQTVAADQNDVVSLGVGIGRETSTDDLAVLLRQRGDLFPAENFVNVVSGVGFAGYEGHVIYPRIESIKSEFMSAFLIRSIGSN